MVLARGDTNGVAPFGCRKTVKKTQLVGRLRRPAAATALSSAFVFVAGCTPTQTVTTLPDLSVFTPAEVIEPVVPAGDPVDPLTTTSLSLEQLLVYADAHSPAIQTARARVGLTDPEVVGAGIVFPAKPEGSLGAGGRAVDGAPGVEFGGAVEQQLVI